MIVLGYIPAEPEENMHDAAVRLRDRMLSELCGIRDAVILRTEHGKPYLAGTAGISFSVSHTDRLAACVLSFPGTADAGQYAVLRPLPDAPEVGCDAEIVRPAAQAERMRRIACRFCPSDAAEEISRMPDAEVPEAFARLWTLCESFVKMTGEGFGRGFAGLDFTGIVSPVRRIQLDGKVYILRAAWRRSGENVYDEA